MSDKETLAVYDARAADYAQCFNAGEAPDTQMQSFLAALPKEADVLDLGCGPGGSAAMIAGAGHRVTAWDGSAKMVELAGKHPGVTARQAFFDELTGVDCYDAIWANFSLLHAAPEALPGHLDAIAQALRGGGIFHIGMKLGQGTKRDSLGRKYTFVGEEELKGWLSDLGLVVFAAWTGHAKGFAGTDDPYVVMQARKDG